MSKHIQLFQNIPSQQLHDSKLNQNRPQKLNLSHINVANQKWIQYKIFGKNISIRSYAAACSYNHQLYLYGGFQILNGILSDFYKINLDTTESKFQWVEIQSHKNSQYPGPRAKHALFNYKNSIYLIGGIKSASQISNQIYKFDIQTSIWNKVEFNGQFPQLQSFGSTIVEDRIILMCGYNGKLCKYTNEVYEYNITTNKISKIYSHTDTKNQPKVRAGCAIAANGNNIYLFGGKDDDNKYNDLWIFNLQKRQYNLIDIKQTKPLVRNGHTLNYYQGKLYLFGGIHEVTWQLQDLFIFHISKNQWIPIQSDSARKKQKSIQKSPIKNPNSPRQKHGNSPIRKQSPVSPRQKKDATLHFEGSHEGGTLNVPGSPGKMIDQQRKKVFLHRKAEMLKQFQIPQKQKNRYINIQPTSQAMKNSLDIIGNPNLNLKNHTQNAYRLTEFGKASCSKFLQPLSNNVNLVGGKKPCARDGHNAVQIKNDIIIFGGDRHQMSFNDLFKLNISLVNKNVDHQK